MIKEMNDRIRWIEHKGKQILFSDFSDLKGEECINAVKGFEDFLVNLGKHDLLVYVDARNCDLDDVGFNVGRKVAKMVKPYIKKEAIIGITKGKDTLITLVNIFSDLGIKSFNTMDEAIDWLVE